MAEAERDEPRGDEGPDERETVDRTEEPIVQRGRLQLVAVAVSLVGSVILVALLGGSPGAALVLQLAVIGLLVFQTWRGKAWARWTLVVLTAIGAGANGWQAIQLVGEGGAPWWMNGGLALIFAWSAGILALGRALRRFVEVQRARFP
ncbi:MAG TPA: hypothetical protein RMH99_07310 [Sandaracinaceae bacterium LLY-WYZ-13_1]|nr:hypothetical protein [Sandaracinaceae bacterium LLY-WYZ-13_1]